MRSSLIPVMCVLLVAAGGCVERTITIKSTPPGAYVYLEGREVGQTPVTVSFLHHGEREVSVYKTGYERIQKLEKIDPPWFQWFPLDFFFEVLWPGTLKEEHVLSYKLGPAKEVEKEVLLERADELRHKAFHLLPKKEKQAPDKSNTEPKKPDDKQKKNE